MKNYRKKKEEGSQKLIEELAEKEAELKSFQNILAQRQAVYDAQGFDGKKQMHYFENQKIELLERMQTKKRPPSKKLTDECHDAEIHYSRTLDAVRYYFFYFFLVLNKK
ncbi:putative kinetochore protein NDC80 [Caerostris extrusa]|uniref:Kinetochore protein NDC80 n=1 Tax=Caerostris extrusa TaxID=172846 RepID=A0AAV4RWQ2_CAEEX|nr:putative kinetochore protein NDC80 [Caerostris extrusa]